SVGLSSELASALCPEARAADATGIVPTKVDVGVTAPSGVPVGTIIAWPVSRDPDEADKWLDCQGQTVLAADYPDLVAVLAGSSASSAALPDLRGLFLRGHGSQEHSQENGTSVGVTVTTHSSGDLLAVQGDAIRELSGNLPAGGQRVAGATLNDNFSGVFGVGGRGTAPGQGASSGSNLQAYFSAALSTPTDVEIRPVNMAVRYLMRALP
ncbi:MAG: phage tail protein, partial [Desulfovibrionaceae bacterium]|nr:phage tail protein [Desulfovibrionaceae bacterium]